MKDVTVPVMKPASIRAATLGSFPYLNPKLHSFFNER